MVKGFKAPVTTQGVGWNGVKGARRFPCLAWAGHDQSMGVAGHP